MPCTKTTLLITILVTITMTLMMLYYTTYRQPDTVIKTRTTIPYKKHNKKDNITEDCRIHVENLVRKMIKTYDHSNANKGKNVTNTNVKDLRTQTAIKNKKKKVVLAYTAYFGYKPWRWMKNTYEFNHWQGVKCPYFSCELTFRRADRPRSDALIFHARDMPFIDTLRYVLERKNITQRWIYFAMESPMNNPPTNRFNSMFNWIMTYRSDSDVFRPYSYYFESKNIPLKSIKDYLKGKDRLVFWASSRCGLLRDQYVKKLMEYIKVDVFGGCKKSVDASNTDQCPKNSQECEQKLHRYKFQLAFENSFCVDYVTEKYWDGIKSGLVPVVLGGSDYNKNIAIPGSFINAMDFKTVQDLADHLMYLDRNETAYLEYFKWRLKYRVVDYPPWNCLLCARLHLDSKPKMYTWLDKIWNADKQCGKHKKRLEKMVRPGPKTFD